MHEFLSDAQKTNSIIPLYAHIWQIYEQNYTSEKDSYTETIKEKQKDRD